MTELHAAHRSGIDEIKSFCDSVTFRAIQPETWIPLPSALAAVQQIVGAVGPSLEYANTLIPGDRNYKRGLRPLLRTPRASTFAIAAMINHAVSRMPEGQSYLNVGVWNGFSLFAGMINNPDARCIGVDNFCLADKYADKRGVPRITRHYPRKISAQWTQKRFISRFGELRSPNHEFFYMDYVDYLTESHHGPIGVYLYDAMHHYVDQVRGLALAEPFMAPGCIVFVDDTNCTNALIGTLDFIRDSKHTYTVLADRRTRSNHHPTLWNGIMVLRKVD